MNSEHEPRQADLSTAINLAPVGQFSVSADLSGIGGANRAIGRAQISAQTDQEAVLAWLARYADSPNTLANSRREAERLLLWCVGERGKPLSSLTHEDFLVYQRFLADPQPAARWVMRPGRKLGRQDPGWRPFAGPLSDASIRQSMTILNSMLSWLVQAGYLAGNPLALSRRRAKAPAARVTRFLEGDLWDAVRQTIIALPQGTQREQATYARSRWLVSLLFIAGLRISEVVGNAMGDFFSQNDLKTGAERWWLEVLGKGSKTRLVPATAELMVELMAYRRSLGLSDLPLPGESSPLLFPVAWRTLRNAVPEWPAPLTRSSVHGILKDVFALASDSWLSQGRGQAQADKLRAASAHWLRHTAGSNLSNDIDLRYVRDTLGHANLSTTSIYVHGEDDLRHDAISAAHRVSWGIVPRSQ